MKKFIFFRIFIIFALTAMLNTMQAQIINNDKNWDTIPVFIDNFNPPRSNWDANWFDYPNDTKWRAHLITGVTHGPAEHMVYQRENAIFNSADSTIRLRAEYVGGPLNCDDYDIPPNYTCDTSLHSLYYFSGAITTINPDDFLYGYFETRCKLPVNRGAFPAYWLWAASEGNYREIDIFEHSWGMMNQYNCPDSNRIFNGGIWYYNNVPNGIHFGEHGYCIPQPDPGLEEYHSFASEWSPKRVVWYFDNNAIGEYYGDSVPSKSMSLMLNYALDNWVMPGFPPTPIQTGFPNDMTIDYVRVNKLKCDCSVDEIIQNNLQLSAFNYSVKKTITVGGYGYNIAVPANDKVVFRATDGITINGDFEVPLGSELELITHPCPQ